MESLPDKPTLSDLQLYIAALCKEKGWDKNSKEEIFMLFIEEVGELAKAMRDADSMYQEKAKKGASFGLREEFADVLNYLLDLANYFKVDLEQAFREKNKINEKREWERE